MLQVLDIFYGTGHAQSDDVTDVSPKTADASPLLCDEREPVTQRFDVPKPSARARIVAWWSDGAVEHDLEPTASVVLGRDLACDVRLAHASVSRRHARIEVSATSSTLRLHDLGSANGTRVDGRRLASGESIVLRPGALVELGACLLVVRTVDGSEAVSTRRPTSGATSATPTLTPQTLGGASTVMIVEDPAMIRVHELVEVAARSTLSVLLLGETGVGKEVIAARVHELSPRRSAPFCKINCAALVESLLEAELFGYERGAFSGAVASKPGLLESADGGTLFLDELGEMPLTTQAKLLRALETGEVLRVGGLKPRRVDVRVVAATNRDLKELVQQGRFREDLYYRLDGLAVRIPPLRARKSELPSLANALLFSACNALGKEPVGISPEALDRLLAHSWPGNVRELRNVLRRAALFCQGAELEASDIQIDAMGHDETIAAAIPDATTLAEGVPAAFVPPTAETRILPPPPATRAALREWEKARMLEALTTCAGNQTRAAMMLGMSRRTFVKRMSEFALPRPRKPVGKAAADAETQLEG